MLYRILAILLIIGLTVFYSLHKKESFESQLASSEAILGRLPQADFEGMDGVPFHLDDLYKEKPGLVVIHFWGTWCGPCEAELPELLSFIKKYEARKDVKFLLVAVNDEVMKVKKLLKSLVVPHASIHWLLDNKNVHRDVFGTTKVPETYVFSSDKATLRKFVGPQEWNKPMFFQTFDELLQISTTKL